MINQDISTLLAGNKGVRPFSLNGKIWLLLVYGKSMRENIPAHMLRQIKEEIKNA
jgi:hypothetical protein